MALVIASQLRKELSGWTLFDGVSFKVERRDRIALSGPNGAGKTTLLRILNGETEYQGGELVFSKGTRVAPTTRPPFAVTRTRRHASSMRAATTGASAQPRSSAASGSRTPISTARS